MSTLSTGELAALFQISKYKIRHYIDEGILVPKRNSENGYYFFEEVDIYRLYQIILLRKMGCSIQEIKESLFSENVTIMLEQAESRLSKQIKELQEIQKNAKKIIYSQKKIILNKMIFVEREDRYYQKLPDQIIDEHSINYSQAAKLDLPHLDELVFIFSEDESEIVCLKSNKETSDFFFPAGKYASKSFIAENEATIKNQINIFLEELAYTSKYPASKNIIIYENIYPSLAYRDAMVYSIEVKL
ncbi:putative transcriptional regulator, MerR family [Listeria seeligeri FSL S4-171]|uniref:MerR family transcriptional regulator n=2 Tax=Listeria seeligeri TaxID=1640 RepID=UPI0001EB7F90|nr:MerR family transcriptional regulator [Listeria seeligeri]EFS03574.1 putative transcriptional regulator, MerR family [Listeria seeligeri FSL S4-171]MBF2665200.1 MerR family transcriptional regulator [Listeria seeligeri]